MNFFSKIILFITSYFPLFIIFWILNFDKNKDYYFNYPILSWSMIIIVLLSLVLVFILMRFSFRRYIDFNIQNKIDMIENWNHEILAYLFTYVIPFISISDKKKIYILSILLLVTFIIYYKSELLKYNIFLLFLWYDIIKVTLDDNSSIFIIKKTNYVLKRWDMINYWKISENLYLLKSWQYG